MLRNKNSQNNSRRGGVDRFVFPRDSLDDVRTRSRLYQLSRQPTGYTDIWSVDYLKTRKNKNHFKQALGLNDKKYNYLPSNLCYVSPWPCTPRRRSYLSSADSVLDLPYYRNSSFPDLIDWNRDGILVAALDTTYYNWSWRTQTLVGGGNTKEMVFSCKFDPLGNYLLLGQNKGVIEVHDYSGSKAITITVCNCRIHQQHPYCQVASIDWSPKGDTFVTGCTRGRINMFANSGLCISTRKVSVSSVYSTKCSPNGRFVVAVSNLIAHLYLSPFLEPISTICSSWMVKCVTWHPWSSALLAVGFQSVDNNNCALALYDATPLKKTCHNEFPKNYNVDEILFSKRTGEMVLSLWDDEWAEYVNKGRNKIVVLKDFSTVVDSWCDTHNMVNIRKMIFSPDGSKLATATEDEDLIIWNFLPECGSNDPRKRGLRKPMLYNLR